jgi:hypothetical protein
MVNNMGRKKKQRTHLFGDDLRSSKYIAVENVINVNDPYILWYYIPGYNGYEISNTLYVRSMKHYMKFPYGILVQPKKNKEGKVSNPEDPTFELTNNNNERTAIRLSQIVHLAKTNPYAVYGYPRRTYHSDGASRNLRCFLKKQIPTVLLDNTARFPKFTVIDEAKPDDKFKIKMKEDVIVPIISMDDSTYYGRDDIIVKYK